MNGRLGSAAWQVPAETERDNQWKPGTIWLGRSANGIPLGYRDDRHVTLVAGNRAGKGTSVIVPTILTYTGSMMVIDPKGENATIAAGRRGKGARRQERKPSASLKRKPARAKPSELGLPPEWDLLQEPSPLNFLQEPVQAATLRNMPPDEGPIEDAVPGGEGLGQAVYVLDPFHVAKVDGSLRARFNPLDEIDPHGPDAIAQAGMIADALVVVRDNVREPFFDETARAMVKALIMHVLTSPAYEGRRNLTTVRRLALRGDWETVEKLRSSGEQLAPAHGLLWQAVSMNTAFGGIVAGLGDSFSDMLANAPKTFENVLQSVNRNLEFMDEPQMQQVVEASDFRLSDLKTHPRGVTVFLSLPQRYMNTHYRWLRMMIALTLARMEMTPTPKGRPPVLLMLDEFAGLKRMEEVEKAVAQTAGFGVKMFFVLQSLEQLKATYKDNWETFLANSGLKILFNLGDHFSRDYVSKLIGEMELSRETANRSDTQSENESMALGASSNRTTSRSVASGTSHTVTDGTNHGESHTSGISSGMSFLAPAPLNMFGPKLAGLNAGTQSSDTQSSGRSHSEAIGTSTTETNSESDAWGNSMTATRGNGASRMAGTSETLHRRALIHPDEIGRQFARVEPGEPAYPGLALVLVDGRQPAPVRRVNYYEDYEFTGLFDAHPDHDVPRLVRQSWGGRQVMQLWSEFTGNGGGAKGRSKVMWADEGDGRPAAARWLVRRGEPLMYVPVVRLGQSKFDLAAVRAPRTGVIVERARQTGGGSLFVMEYYDTGETPLNPFAEISAMAARAGQELQLAVATGAVRVLNYSPAPAVAAPEKPRSWLEELWQGYMDACDSLVEPARRPLAVVDALRLQPDAKRPGSGLPGTGPFVWLFL